MSRARESGQAVCVTVTVVQIYAVDILLGRMAMVCSTSSKVLEETMRFGVTIRGMQHARRLKNERSSVRSNHVT